MDTLDALSSAELFPHVRVVMGMVIGLGITRLLAGAAGFIQHPGRIRPYPIHLLWVMTLLLELVHFWWWQYALYSVHDWTFGLFLFLIGYSIVLYFMCALLFPDKMDEYAGYEDYFFSRRRWFFGLFALTFLCDVVDSLLKGANYFSRFGPEYYGQVAIGLALCVAAAWTGNRRFHLLFVVAHLIYQISWIARLYTLV